MKKFKKHIFMLAVLLLFGIAVTLNAGAIGNCLHLTGGNNVKAAAIAKPVAPKKLDEESRTDIQPVKNKVLENTSQPAVDTTKDVSEGTNSTETDMFGWDSDGNTTESSNVTVASINGTSLSSPPTQPSRNSMLKPRQSKPAVSIPITGISLNSTEISLKKGSTAALVATISPVNATQSKAVSWTSANPKIATVDATGKVTAVGGGTATIIASTSNGKTAVCNVAVAVPVTRLSLNLTDLSLDKGETRAISATVDPADATEKAVWSTSDGKVAVVDANGNVTARNPGLAIITATAGSAKATCNVSVGISISRVVISDRQVTLKKGSSKILTAWVDPPDTTENAAISWLTSNSKIATVDQDGNVTAVEGGNAVITAKAGTHTAQCTVNVIVPVTGMKLLDTDVERGTTKAMNPAFEPEDATDRAAAWTSSDESVATVDATGKVFGLKIGKTTITAVSHDGGFTARCTVNVIVPIKEIDLSKNDITLKKGDTESITATILPEDTTEDRTVKWSTSDPGVATVDSTGKITAVEGGSATITATVGDHKADCHVQVIVPLTGISFSADAVRLPVKTDMTLNVIYAPIDATDKDVAWSSSNSDVVTVDSSGKLHGIATGSATVTAVSHDGGYTANCSVTVVIPVTGISLDQSSITLKKSETSKLTATIVPKDATDQAMQWSTSNPEVATVDDSGNITAVEGGTATVTATTHDGGFTAPCKVTIIVPVTGISLDKSAINLATGSSTTLKTIFQPEDATDTAISWSSSAPNIISVDQNGVVTAIAETGTATITATSHDGNFTVSCTATISNTPSMPQNLTSSISNYTTLLLKWDSPESDGHSPITTYKITLNDKSYSTTKTTYSIDCPDVSMLTVTVCAANANGDGSVTTKKYDVIKGTRYWKTQGSVTSYEKTGRHWVPKTVYVFPDGSSSFQEAGWVDDYGYVTRPCEVSHSGPYYVITEVTG